MLAGLSADNSCQPKPGPSKEGADDLCERWQSRNAQSVDERPDLSGAHTPGSSRDGGEMDQGLSEDSRPALQRRQGPLRKALRQLAFLRARRPPGDVSPQGQ